MQTLLNKIKNKKANILIIGLGYVGLPLAKLINLKGYQVSGLDLNLELTDFLRKKNNFKIFNSYKKVNFNLVDIIILTLPTPLKKNKVPDLSYIESCMKNLLNKVKRKTLIILESTSYPGTTNEKIIVPLSKKFKFFKFS